MARSTYLAQRLPRCRSPDASRRTMQGYADRTAPERPAVHLAAIVNAPLPIAQAMQASFATAGDEIGHRC